MGYRNYSTANGFIVDKLGNGDFTTISAAITAAVSGDTIFIRDGTYTENPTLKSGVNLTAFSVDASTPNVTIVGSCTMTTAGSVNISNIRLQTNSNFFLIVSGSAASIVVLDTCFLNCTNNTGISFTSSSASANISINDCVGNLATTGIGLYSSSSSGTIGMNYTILTNTGASTTATTLSAGSVEIGSCNIAAPLSTTGTAGIALLSTTLDTSAQNTIAFTANGTGNQAARFSFVAAGSASAITVGVGATLAVSTCDVASTNTNPITGLGTINYDLVAFSNSSSNINTSTINGLAVNVGSISFDNGTDKLANYVQGTFTPTMTGASVAGSTTYITQTGNYTRIGNRLLFSLLVNWSAATGTGQMKLGGLPFSTNGADVTAIVPMLAGGVGISAANYPEFQFQSGTSTALLFQYNGTTATLASVAMQNAGVVQLSGQYQI